MGHFVMPLVLSLLSVIHAFNYHNPQCLLYNGKCVAVCPRDMHAYHTRCDGQTVSQLTCSSPLQYIIGFTCGWSRCDCNGNLIWDDQNGYCVNYSECPVHVTRRSRRKNRRGVEECPENMHRVNSECRPTRSQRTCDEPVATSMGVICQWSRCDCDFPFVLHLPSGYCFAYEDCPYTGHCPLLKFRYGKCYGDNTRQILKEIRSKGLFNKPMKYRPGDNYEINNMPRHNAPMHDVYEGTRHRQPAYMTGYTGYVPGMNFTYGKSYGRAADDCMADFTANQRELQRKADFNRSFVRSRSAPKMETVHSRDEIRRDLSRFREIHKYKENTISPEFPPIAGYTGHIPRIKGSEASLSQRYHCAAKRGLELIKMERDKRKELQNANVNIKAILKDHDRKYSYWNWG